MAPHRVGRPSWRGAAPLSAGRAVCAKRRGRRGASSSAPERASRASASREPAEPCEEASEEEGSSHSVRRIGTNVYFYCDVTRETVFQLMARLQEARREALLHHQPPRAPAAALPVVHIYIHSDGGDVYAGISGKAHLQRFGGVELVSVVDGYVASAATLLLLGCSRRICLRNSNVLIHQLRTSFAGKFSDLLDEATNSSALMETFASIYRAETTLSKKRIAELLSKEIHLSDEECLAAGLVHAIV